MSLVFFEVPTDLRRFLSDSGVLEVVEVDKLFASFGAAIISLKHRVLNARRQWDIW